MRSRVVAVVVGLLAGVMPFAPSPVKVDALVAGASAYTPIAPTRAADTRPEYGSYGYTRLNANTIRIQITGRSDLPGVPKNASAVVLNIASSGAAGAGFVTAFPTGGSIPTASSLNIDYPGRIIANLATVRLGAGGSVDLYSNVPMDLIVDVAGAYAPVSNPVAAGRLVTIPGGARRALDTRDRGFPMARDSTEYVDLSAVGVPADATAVVVNLAATEAFPGFWTAYPTGVPRPNASSLNIDQALQTRNSQGIIALNPGPRGFNIYSMCGGHLIVDVVGWFTGSSSAVSEDGLFVPTGPLRTLDTRNGRSMPLWGQSTVEFSTLSPFPAQTAAVAMNIAVTEPLYLGFITAYPAGVPRPLAANLNITALDQIISNHAISRAGTRAVSVYTQSGAHIVIDVTGWYIGSPDQSTLPVEPIPSYGPSYATSVRAPSVGIATPVTYGTNIDRIVDTGAAALWGGYGQLGVQDHNIYFAHRTSAKGPFRNLNYLVPGTTFNLVGADGRVYIYLVMRNEIILPYPSLLLDLAVNSGPVTATLVACHPPGSTRYRIVVSGRLIGVA
jgi:LPXTG-site transpeptidase (sortase) family protein